MKVGKLWMDGGMVPAAEATTNVLSHSLHYGSGVFEGIRCYRTERGPAVFRLEDHIERLFYSARTMGLKIPYSPAQMADACKTVLRSNELSSAYIRPLVFYGHDTLGVPPRKCPTVCVVAAWEWGAYVAADSPRVMTSRFTRVHPGTVDCEAKVSGHYVNSLMAVREAHAAGFHEALLLDHKGDVAECSGENVFAVRDGGVFTPPRGNILPGITRATVMELLEARGRPVTERSFRREFLTSADEAFMTGTAAEVTPISELDDAVLTEGAGPLTQEVRQAYLDVVHGRDPRFERYCDYVD